MPALPSALDALRYEILPFGAAESEARATPTPLTLTVTCSPKQGIDHTLDVACTLREIGHGVIVHVAARTVRSAQHLDELLGRMASHGIGDVFLVGGDDPEPLGPYSSALELLPELRASPHAPRTIGVAAYPEGHPSIPDDVLAAALASKDGVADYMTTQLCFDSDVLLRWLERTRDAGVALPLYVGLPGIIEHRRLLQISLRVGVGASMSFVRKQRGLRRLLGRRGDMAQRLFSAYAPLVGRELGIAGMHFFTFNGLVDTARFVDSQADARLGEFTRTTAPLSSSNPREFGLL